MFNFEKLDVWQNAIDFGDPIYNAIRFWSEDRFLRIYAGAEELSRMLSGLRKSSLSTLNSQL
jgi:hypothetical protein